MRGCATLGYDYAAATTDGRMNSLIFGTILFHNMYAFVTGFNE